MHKYLKTFNGGDFGFLNSEFEIFTLQGGFTEMSDSGGRNPRFSGQKARFSVKNPVFGSKTRFLGQKGPFEVVFGSKNPVLRHLWPFS